MAKEGNWTIAQVHEHKFWEDWIANYKKEHPDDDAWQGDRKGGLLQWTHDANVLLRILESQGKELTEASRILEIGGGLVGHSRWLPRGHLFAVDPLQDFFGAAFSELGLATQQVRQDVTYIGHKAEELAHDLEPFDVILILNCLDHCDEPAQVVANMVRLLKPDGMLFEATTVWPVGYLHGGTRSEMVKTHPYIFEGNELIDLFECFDFELIQEPLVKEWMIGAWPRELRLWKIGGLMR